jgi:hypothetical protein
VRPDRDRDPLPGLYPPPRPVAKQFRAAAALLLACFPLTCHLAPAILGVAAPDAAEAATDELSALSAEYGHRLEGLDPDSPEAWRLRRERNRRLNEVRRKYGLPEVPE